jgi:hypothetical protein
MEDINAETVDHEMKNITETKAATNVRLDTTDISIETEHNTRFKSNIVARKVRGKIDNGATLLFIEAINMPVDAGMRNTIVERK